MSHKTMIDGVAYEISGGKTLVNGTAYSIDKGKTLVGGTAYEISFSNLPSIGIALNDCTPEQIQAVTQARLAPSYWAVGDRIGIYLNGTVGALSLSGTYYAFIIGFNHNSGLEGSNTIHFQFGKTSGGVDIAFVDSSYDSTGSSAAFRMNTSKTNSGGWSESYMRTTICPAFLAIMPSAWKNVIKACTKYTDNVGGGGKAESSVTATQDKIWLLSEYEAKGDASGVSINPHETSRQAQYTYYANGNSLIKYKHSSTSVKSTWWTRSPTSAGNEDGFRYITTAGGKLNDYGNSSIGFAPGFMVA